MNLLLDIDDVSNCLSLSEIYTGTKTCVASSCLHLLIVAPKTTA